MQKVGRQLGNFAAIVRASLDFLPEAHWIAQLAQCNLPQPNMTFRQHVRRATFVHGIAIASFNRFARGSACHYKSFFSDRVIRAHQQPHQIRSIRRWPRFIEVVHSPDQPPFQVAPGAKIIHVQIANSQHLRSARQFRTNNWPQLRPTIKRRTHERENRIGHHAMLQNQIAAHNRNLLRLPPLQIQSSSKDRWQILYGRLDRFHLIERSLPL